MSDLRCAWIDKVSMSAQLSYACFEWISCSRWEVKKQQKQVAFVQQGVETKQTELVDAVKEKEIYENYRRQKWDDYKKAVLAEEQQFLDEIAMRNHHIQNSVKV